MQALGTKHSAGKEFFHEKKNTFIILSNIALLKVTVQTIISNHFKKYYILTLGYEILVVNGIFFYCSMFGLRENLLSSSGSWQCHEDWCLLPVPTTSYTATAQLSLWQKQPDSLIHMVLLSLNKPSYFGSKSL